jgi:hypothetical protein
MPNQTDPPEKPSAPPASPKEAAPSKGVLVMSQAAAGAGVLGLVGFAALFFVALRDR